MKEILKIKKIAVFKKKNSNFAKTKEIPFIALQIKIYWRIKKILVYCMTKHVLNMPIKFKVGSLIFSRVMTAAIFENVVSRKMRLKL